MPLVGGGGAGNVAGGANPSGTSSSLVYLGDNKYAGWSGTAIAVDGTNAKLFDFTTQSQAILAEITYMVNDIDLDDAKFIGLEVSINGELIGNIVDNSSGARSLGTLLTPLRIAFPAQSRIVIEGTTNDASDITVSAVIIGKGV